MAFDRKIFKIPFSISNPPQWPCPVCERGILEEKKGTFTKEETVESKKGHKIIDWEPDWIRYIYSCQFQCTSSICGAIVMNIGKGTVDHIDDIDIISGYQEAYYDLFSPIFFTPHLKIFKVSDETPEDMRESINNSFDLFFVDHSASANSIRIALEQLLDHFKVKKFDVKNGKRIRLSLHKRISLVPNKFSDFREAFYAIKWLGNDGSHSKSIKIDDLMDAYEIFESVLDEIFGKKSKRTRSLVSKINKGR